MVFDRYVLHLFSGSGGGVLGSILLGEEIVGAVEFEKYPRETLLARQRDGILPTFPIWDDVCTFRVDNEETREYIEFLISIRERLTIAGGFPCQDISIAGKGVGIDGDRSGLWSEMCRIISEIRPRHILLENSPMLIVRGFDRVISDLAKIRYSLAWSILGASDVGANHQRDRFWGFGTAEEYLDRERDSYSNTDSDGCDRFMGGGRSCETDSNFRGVSLARLVEVEPHKMWNTPTTMDALPPKSAESLEHEALTNRAGRAYPGNLRDHVTQGDVWTEIQGRSKTDLFNGGGITYPTPVASEARQGFQNRNNGKKGTQKSLTTVVIERNSRLRPQETTKAAIQKNILSEETISDNSPTMSNMELGGDDSQPQGQGIGKGELQTQNICKVQTEDSTEWGTLTHSSDSIPRSRKRWRTPVCSDANMNGIQKGFQLHLAEQVRGMKTDE